MYSEGELILYGRTGVCRVGEIVEKTLAGEKVPQLFYTLQPLYQNCSIFLPVSSKVFSRPIIGRAEAEELIAELAGMDAEPYHNRNLNQLRDYYKQKIESYDCRELFLLIISIWRKKKECEAVKKKFGAVDERFLHEAEELLYGELAAALDMEKGEILPYIKSHI